jgi:hypothetical protein
MQIRKKGGWNEQKSSSLKLLSQSQPNYKKALTETILKGDHLRIISAKFG